MGLLPAGASLICPFSILNLISLLIVGSLSEALTQDDSEATPIVLLLISDALNPARLKPVDFSCSILIEST